MTVGELKQRIQLYPDNLPVRYFNAEYNEWDDIYEIDIQNITYPDECIYAREGRRVMIEETIVGIT